MKFISKTAGLGNWRNLPANSVCLNTIRNGSIPASLLKSGVFTARAEPFDGLFGVFNDSLPDGWGKLLIDKWLQSKGVNPAELSVLDRLSLVGDSGMGALTYLPAQNTDSMELHQIGFYASEAEKIIHQDYSGALEEFVNKAGS